MSFSSVVNLFAGTMTDGEKLLLWRFIITTLAAVHIAWACSLIPGLDGFVWRSEHVQLEQRVKRMIETEVFQKVEDIRYQVDSMRQLQEKSIVEELRQNLFAAETTLCILNEGERKASSDHLAMVVEQVRTLADRYEALTKRKYLLNRCTGLQ